MPQTGYSSGINQSEKRTKHHSISTHPFVARMKMRKKSAHKKKNNNSNIQPNTHCIELQKKKGREMVSSGIALNISISSIQKHILLYGRCGELWDFRWHLLFVYVLLCL